MSVRLYIEPTDLSPEIDFDLETNKFIIRGRSMPENSEKFFNPIFDWMRENLSYQFLDVTVDVALEYYNTGSFIRLMALFNLLDELNKTDNKFRVRWIVEAGDEDNMADGESFREVIKIPFEIIEV